MKITEDVRKYAAEQGVAEEEALAKGNGRKWQRALREGVIGLMLQLKLHDDDHRKPS